MWYLYFSFWLPSLNIIISRSIHVAANGIISFFLWLSSIALCIYICVDIYTQWHKKWQPTPVLLPGKSHGRRSLVGRLQSMGWLRVGHNWAASLSRIGEGSGNPLQGFCLENLRDGGAWWVAVYGVAQSRTQLAWLSSSSSNFFLAPQFCYCIFSFCHGIFMVVHHLHRNHKFWLQISSNIWSLICIEVTAED